MGGQQRLREDVVEGEDAHEGDDDGLVDGAADAGGAAESSSPFNAPTHPPIPIEEYEQTDLLAMEKESIGIFISDHPLKRVREALRMKADCGCADVMQQRDGEWVKVGGMVTAAKKIRARSTKPRRKRSASASRSFMAPMVW